MSTSGDTSDDFEGDAPMKPLEYPRVSLIWGGVGVLLFLTLGLMDVASGAPAFRVAAYFLLVIGAIYIFVRALMTILGKTRQQDDRHNPQSGSNPENRSI